MCNYEDDVAVLRQFQGMLKQIIFANDFNFQLLMLSRSIFKRVEVEAKNPNLIFLTFSKIQKVFCLPCILCQDED